MSIPGWLLDVGAGIALLAAALSAGALLVVRDDGRRGGADADIALSEILTGIAMAGVLVTGLRILPNAAWAVVFAAMTAWFDWRLWRQSREHGAAAAIGGPYAPLLVGSAAMLYIFTALAKPSSDSGMAGMSGMVGGSPSALPVLRAPTLAFVFAVLLIAFTVRDLDRRPSAEGYFQAGGRRVALGVTMAFLLITMI